MEKINIEKLNYTEDLLRVIFFWIGTFFLVSGILSFLGILKPAVNSGIQNPDMLGTVFSITGVLLCIISAALGIYTAKLDKLHLQLIEKWYKSEGLGRKSIFAKNTQDIEDRFHTGFYIVLHIIIKCIIIKAVWYGKSRILRKVT